MRLKSKIISLFTSLAILLSFSQSGLMVLAETYNTLTSIEYGDIVDDGKINVTDNIYLTSYLIDNTKKINTFVADLNGDNNINVQDLLLLKRYILGVIKYFPIQQDEFDNILSNINNNRNIETQMNVDMLLIAEVYNTPLKIYEYLKNNINYDFYWGSKKGAIGTYEQLSGNDIDQASLLISFLNYLGYQANYITGDIEISKQQAMDWTCADDFNSALNILGLQFNIISNTTSSITLEHTWVEANIDNQTIQLDPSFKKYSKNDNNIFDNLEQYGINEDELYNASLDNDIYSFNAALKENSQSKSAISIKSRNIVKEDLTTLPSSLPYKVLSQSPSFPNVNDNISNKIVLVLDEDSATYKSAELYNKNITIEYLVYDELAEALGTSSSYNIFDINTNKNLKLKPVLLLDNKKVLTGTPIGLNSFNQIGIGIKTNPNDNNVVIKELKPGSMYSINFDMGTISADELVDKYNSVYNSSNSVNENNIYSNDYMGNLLNLAGKMYFSQLDLNNHLISELNNIYAKNNISVCVTAFELEIFNGLISKTLKKEGKFCTDVLSNSYSISSFNSDDDMLKNYFTSFGMMSSALEDVIWREITGIQSVSTVKVLERAYAEDIDILMISSANADTELSKIANVIDSASYSEITQAVNSGQIVTIPSQLITINNWTGTGFIITDGQTGISTYRLTDKLNGGQTSDLVTLAYCINIFCDISDIISSIEMISIGIISIAVGVPVAGGVILVGGIVCLTCSVLSYCDDIDLMCQYMQGDESAGNQLILNAGINIVAGAVSYGINAAIKEYAVPAIQNKVAREYTEDFAEKVAKYPDFISFPDGTLEAFNKCGEYTTDIIDIVSENPGFDIVVTEHTKDVVDLVTEQGTNFLSTNAGMLSIEMYPEITLDVLKEHGENGATALVINGDSYIQAYTNGDTNTVTNMISEADKINNLLDNINIGEKGKLYTYSILAISDTSEQNIEKIAKAATMRLSNMINKKEIVKTTGGKINAKVVTVAIDGKTGKVYYGISGYKANPTRKLLSNNETEQHEILKKMINDFGESLTNYPIDNCGEFNAVNNALFDKANISDLHMYSVLISNNEYWPPCANCQGLYDSHVNFIKG